MDRSVEEETMRKRSLLVVILVFVSMSFAALSILPMHVKASVLYVGGTGPGNYTHIQTAIDDASPGDTIYIYNGTYYESIQVYKSLSLKGENRNTTIINGAFAQKVVHLTADSINITEITVTNGGFDFDNAGIELDHVQNCRIAHNNISSNHWDGIRLVYSNDNTIINNTIVWNDLSGIYLYHSSNNTIDDNNISSNQDRGAVLHFSSNNTVVRNRISSNVFLGIYLFSSARNAISDNVMIENGIHIYGNSLQHWNTHTMTNNTVNGKPVRYWKNVVGGKIPSGTGQAILSNCTNVVIENQNITNASVGIQLGFSSDATIANNTVAFNNLHGIYLGHSANITIDNNTLLFNWYGVYFDYSDNNIATNNTAQDNGDGIGLFYSMSNTLIHNALSKNQYGIHLSYSNNNAIANNTASENSQGFFLYSAYNNTITDNSVSLSEWSGNWLYFSEGNTISNNTVIGGAMGVSLDSSNNNTVVNNDFSTNSLCGVYVDSSDGNVVLNNTLSSNSDGISIWYSTGNSITKNKVSMSDNFGLTLIYSVGITISNNSLIESGIGVWGSSLEHWNTHTIVTTNTVNGKPVYYWKNATGGTIPSDAGEVILANCTDVIVENQNLSKGSVGVLLGFSSSNLIRNNTVLNGKVHGIQLRYSGNNTITSNIASFNNVHGIDLEEANGNTVANNTASSNNRHGISLGSSNWNTITHNDVSKNQYGIRASFSNRNRIVNNSVANNTYGVYLFSSSNNEVYHNTFLDNVQQGYGNTNASQWDNGYPSGGNHWNDYTGVDERSGPGQDEPGSDGIGDTPYIIDGVNQDRYPLMSPFERIRSRPPILTQTVLSGNRAENVTLAWSLSPDDGIGRKSVVGYHVHRNMTYNPKGFGYELIASLPNGTTDYVDVGMGNSNQSCLFYLVCAVNDLNVSSCSPTQAGKFTRPLASGSNLVSIPLIQSNESIETVLQTVEYDKAWYYDSPSQEWKWYMTSKGYRRGLWSVNLTKGMWVNVTENSNLTVAGVVPTQTTIHLYEGWNLVSFPSFNSSYTVSDLRMDTGALRVEGYDPTPPYHLRVLGDADVLQAGYGYWVKVQADADWIVEVS